MKPAIGSSLLTFSFNPHARAGYYMIRTGVHIYMCVCLWTKKSFESYFSNRLTFSNIRGRTSCQIYRLATTAFSRNAFFVE